MELSDITVLIPSIGRQSLLRAIKSIPSGCKIKVLLQGPTDYKFISSIEDLIGNCNLSVSKDKLGAGKAKQDLIDRVDTEFFMILDDDDWIPEEYLENCLPILDKGFKWISPCILGPQENKGVKYTEINSAKDVERRLFNYDSFSETYARYHLYPCNSSIISTEEFKKLGERFHLSYADDLIPILNFYIHYKGVFLNNDGLLGDTNRDSVSRQFVSKDKFQAICREVNIKVFESKTKVEKDIWKQALINTFDRVYHVNSLCNER